MNRGKDVSVEAEEVRSRAISLAEALRDRWNEDLLEFSEEARAMTGLALAHAVAKGWIEPDPSKIGYFESAEDLLEGGDADATESE